MANCGEDLEINNLCVNNSNPVQVKDNIKDVPSKMKEVININSNNELKENDLKINDESNNFPERNDRVSLINGKIINENKELKNESKQNKNINEMDINVENNKDNDKHCKIDKIFENKDSDNLKLPKGIKLKKTYKRELPNDSSCSSNLSKGKRRQRSYRARFNESSSEDDDSNTCQPSSSNDSENIEKIKSDKSSIKETDKNNLDESDNDFNDNIFAISSSNSPSDLSSSRNKNENEVQNAASTNVGNNEDDIIEQEHRQPASGSGRRVRRLFSRFSLDSDSDDFTLSDDDNEDNENDENVETKKAQRLKEQEKINKEVDEIIKKSKPKNDWNAATDIFQREYGSRCNRYSASFFTNKYYDSLHVAQLLKISSKLDYHSGCVNALSFNDSGELLASGSDDLQIAVWDWKRGVIKTAYDSGHRNNVFQCKFLPGSNSTLIASCARDGMVRLATLCSSGVCKDTRKIAKHSRSAHKLATRPQAPFEVMSAGEDAVVYNIDVRTDSPDKLVLVKDVHGAKVALYSISENPLNENQFCVSGQDEFVRVFDRRIISTFAPAVLKYCPRHLLENKPRANVTCAVYSNTGDSILASYNDDDIYLFDTSQTEAAAAIHRYSGHRNSSTVKGVNFFSPNSRYVVSGSDCGNLFVWHRETEAIVNCDLGDVNGVVNVLEPHPVFPLLATSGLDSQVKLWYPTKDEKSKANFNLHKTVHSNMYRRHREFGMGSSSDDRRMLMMLFRHLDTSAPFTRRASRRGEGREDEGDMELDVEDSSSSNEEDEGHSDDSEEERNSGERLLQCPTQ